MSKLAAGLHQARETGDFDALLAQIPYARFMGFQISAGEAGLIVKMPFADHLIGNGNVDALHGGTLGSLMESAGIFTLLWAGETVRVPKTINITVEYLRKAERGMDTYARAEIIRHGRRVANVRTFCWQRAEGSRPPARGQERLVAAANAHFLLAGEDVG